MSEVADGREQANSGSPDSSQPANPATPSIAGPSAPVQRAVNRRSRSGCLTCRRRRIKCDERHPTCERCAERSAQCEWPSSKPFPTPHKHPRSLRSCENCRQRKTRCEFIQNADGSCSSCMEYGLMCVPAESTRGHSNLASRAGNIESGHASRVNATSFEEGPIRPGPSAVHASPLARPPGQLVIRPEDMDMIAELVRLYFTTVHYFGYLSFIHEAEFWDRFDKGNPPVGLTLLMAANALRFGGRSDAADQIDLADRWAAEAGERLISQAMLEFGAIELMEVVLYHHYEFQCGRYSRGWILAGMAVRMMTFLRLHMFDESPHPVFKPLLGAESLRRLAWGVYFLDATIDGGNYGFTAIPDGSYTIPLPCDEHIFLRQGAVSTEHMIPAPPGDHQPSNLGLAGHLLRAMYARQVLAGLHSRIQRRLIPPASIPTYIQQAEKESMQLLNTIPPDMYYSRTNFHIYKSQQTLFLHLHVLRNTCLRHLALLKILGASYSLHNPNEVSVNRQALIREARQLSALFAQGVDHNVILDPQLAMHAYNGIEVLLYQPLRQTSDFVDPGLSREELAKLLKPLLTVIRELARVSELVALLVCPLYPEAVNRMVRHGFTEDIIDEDMVALLKKVHRLANADTEFDFHDSFWRYEIALQRHRGDQQVPVSPNDLLLEVHSEITPRTSDTPRGGQASATSPMSRLQAMFASSEGVIGSNGATEHDVPGAMNDVGDIDWQAAFSLPPLDLQTLMGAPPVPEQPAMPFTWSFNGTNP